MKELENEDFMAVGSILGGLNFHLQGALISLEECALRLQILAQMVDRAEQEIGGSLWPCRDISPTQADDIAAAIANITRHFLGRPF